VLLSSPEMEGYVAEQGYQQYCVPAPMPFPTALKINKDILNINLLLSTFM